MRTILTLAAALLASCGGSDDPVPCLADSDELQCDVECVDFVRNLGNNEPSGLPACTGVNADVDPTEIACGEATVIEVDGRVGCCQTPDDPNRWRFYECDGG